MLHRETATLTADVAARTITARLCTYDEPRPVVVADGRFTETFQRGSLTMADRVHVTDVHTGNLVGRVREMADDDTGPVATLDIAPTVAGSDLLALVDAGVLDSVSMEFDPLEDDWAADRSAVTRRRAVVHGVAFAFRPAHAAPILTRQTNEGTTTMPETTVMPDTSPVPPVAPTVTAELVTPDVLERSMAEMRDELARVTSVPAGLVHVSPAHPLAQYRSLVDYADAVYADPSLAPLLQRALVDQITTDNPGVIPPGWVSTVYGIMEQSRPLIDAFGTEPLPPAGMDVNWPYFDGNLLDLVGEQATEKSSITSVKVVLEKGSADLHTLAGGSDVSFQLIRRSQPSYRDAYLRIMFAAYAAVSDDYAGGMMLAVPGRGHVALDPMAATADTLRAALFAASLKVRNATGAPATFALASSDVFAKVGALPGLFPAPYGTSNVAGTADAASLRIDVSGLTITEDPFLPNGSLHVSNGSAGSWFEEGPFQISATDVDRLGENIAVWGMGTFGATVPAGIVQVSATAPADSPAATRRANKSKD